MTSVVNRIKDVSMRRCHLFCALSVLDAAVSELGTTAAGLVLEGKYLAKDGKREDAVLRGG